jgi:uncharacterized protein
MPHSNHTLRQTENNNVQWIAFIGNDRITQGSPHVVIHAVHAIVGVQGENNLLLFDAVTSARIDIDWRTDLLTILKQYATEHVEITDNSASENPAPRQAGRPKLGVVAREITLLPRHWEWLSTQTGGASVTLRKLVEQAQRQSKNADQRRLAQESTYRFMSTMAGNNVGFEEATRALFAGDMGKLRAIVASWPSDVARHCLHLAQTSAMPSVVVGQHFIQSVS